MPKLVKFVKQKHILILIVIIAVALFFRTYDLYNRFDYASDADLYGWIVKDIVVDHHIRLIGQQTSAPGIFIGPLFYYSLIPFFLITNMYPTGALILGVIVGMLTLISFYYIFSSLFNRQIGLIAAFLDASLLQVVSFDRWIVPTIYTRLWAIWYFYCLIQITRGNFFVLPILGLLIGLIWHIHIALLPTLIALPVALILSKKLPSIKQFGYFFVALILPSLPFIIFESRHRFQQSIAFYNNFFTPHAGGSDNNKYTEVVQMVGQNIETLFLSPQSLFRNHPEIWLLFMIILGGFITYKKIIKEKELTVLYSWILGSILFFALSTSPISEYYFASFEVIFLAFISITLFIIFKWSTFGKILVLLLLTIVLVKNIYFFTHMYIYKKAYAEKKAIVDVIKRDSVRNNYPCVGISYVVNQGEDVGFRYLIWREEIHTNPPTLQIPVYNIVIPDEISKESITHKFGHIGLIVPENRFDNKELEKICSPVNANTTDSLKGYVE